MRYGNLLLKIGTVVTILAMVALALYSSDALAVCTRYFCTGAVGVFAVASTVGLATRLRA
jgi:hypothetical protein